MARELAITIYLLVFRTLFFIFNLCPQKKKTTFVASFGDNVLYTVEELERRADDQQIVILKTSQCKIDFEKNNRMVLVFEPSKLLDWVRSIYHLATSTHIFIDNYFGFLAVTSFRSNVICVQLWHAAGAIKQFGLKDPSIRDRSSRAHRRFKQVYSNFTHVVVGSEKMATIFKESFGLPDERMLRTGVPRTDFFFADEQKQTITEQLTKQFPVIQKKKVLLYAPTYRDQELHLSQLALDLDMMHKQLSNEYVLFLRLHPAVRVLWKNQYPDFIYDVSTYHDSNHLLLITDILITDYSSIPFEFALLQKPMVFFAYDLEEYRKSRGFWEEYEKMVPGPVVKNTAELVDVLIHARFDHQRIQSFAYEWNEYSIGHSSEQLIVIMYHLPQEQGNE